MNTKELATIHGVDNITSMWLQATANERLDGVSWYGDAQAVARGLATEYDVTVSQAAGVLAALSPNVAWSQNVDAAEKAIKAHKAGFAPEDVMIAGYPANKAKAWRILGGELPGDVLGGQKVRAFYCNIMGDGDIVTVDRHAYSVWFGVRIITTPTISPTVHAAICKAYVEVASRYGVSPSAMQATTWVTYRRLNGITN